MDETLSIGELAARSGVSVRALRLYEEARLLKPLRTEAGRRIYRAADIATLQQVLLLKTVGCTLAQIAGLLKARELDPAALLDAQIAVLEQRRLAVEQTLSALKAARRQITDGKGLSVEDLCKLIKRGDCDMTHQDWQAVYDRYYTPEEQARWAAAVGKFSEEDRQIAGQHWMGLVAEVEAAIAAGAAPGDERAMQLAKAWYDLQKPLADAVGAAAWAKGHQIYAQMDQWRSETAKPPFSPEVFAFINAAAEAARAKGLIPPRVEAA
jgi:DNA-binding transcriptional MerR regulator